MIRTCGVAIAVVVSVSVITPLLAQPPKPASLNETVRLALQNAPALTVSVPITNPPPRKFGVVTLLPPDSHSGEFVRLSVPIGEVVARGVRGIRAARYRRSERIAREAVKRDLADFEARQHK